MKLEKYFAILLTIIAIDLTIIVLQNFEFIPHANADSIEQFIIPNEDGSLNVVVKEIVPVEIEDQPIRVEINSQPVQVEVY